MHIGEALEGSAFSADDLARLCGVTPQWVFARVEAGVLLADTSDGQTLERWRFDSITLVRARRVAHLEATFEADPQLAALTTDLIEEVSRLRRRLMAIEGQQS